MTLRTFQSAALGILISGCTMPGVSALRNDETSLQNAVGPRRTAEHVYVTDYGTGGTHSHNGRLIQFAVHDGVAVAPARITVRGLHSPIGVAVDQHGLVYIAETGYGHHAIDVYDLSGNNTKRVREILFPNGFTPVAEYLTVGTDDYLFASMDYTNIAVFRPREAGLVKQPHYLQNTSGAFQLGADEAGDVYQPTTDFLYVHPGNNKRQARSLTKAVVPDPKYRCGCLQMSRSDGPEIFIGPTYASSDWVTLGVLSAHKWGHVVVQRSMTLENGCWIHRESFGVAVALEGNFLYETCAYLQSKHFVSGVWTFNKSGSGNVQALHFAKSPPMTPGDIAVGP